MHLIRKIHAAWYLYVKHVRFIPLKYQREAMKLLLKHRKW